MKTLIKVLSIVCAVAMLACAFVGCSQKAPTANNTTFKIGLSGPLTGGAAMYGQAVANAAQMAVDEINANGGLFGSKLEFVTYDDAHDPTKVSTGYASMYQKGVQATLGCVTTKPCLEFKALSKDDNVFFITPSATGDAVPAESNGYQLCFSDSNQGVKAAEYVKEHYEGKTIGVLYCAGDDYSEGILKRFENTIGTSVTVVKASFKDGDTDFSSQVKLLKDCEFVFMPIYYDPASSFMLEANKTENSIKVYYGCDGLDGIDAIEGFDIKTVPQEVSYLSHFNSKSEDAAVKTFVQKYTEKYGSVPTQFAAAGYDCVYAIYNALLKAGEEKVSVTMSASDMCNVLKEQFDGDFSYSGVTGKDMKWNKAANDGYGYVEKAADKVIVKEADTQ